MIVCNFDIHEYMYAVEGFAHGSHLRQHIWEKMFCEHLPQMDDKMMDYCWWIMRRDIWSLFMEGDKYTPCGKEDFLHALAALHRGNRYEITFLPFDPDDNTRAPKPVRRVLCYRFGGKFCPLPQPFNKKDVGGSFNSFIPDEWILHKEQKPMPENEMVEYRHNDWWEDLSIYEP